MKRLLILLIPAFSLLNAQYPSGKEILDRIDENLYSENRIITSKMVIHGPRSSRTIESKSWSVGDIKAYTEYISPPREAGTKMLKLEDALWIYSPSTDRTIQISGHMLRQSVMGSDLSYEDMMDDTEMSEDYDAVVIGEETYQERLCWIVELNATSPDVSYQLRKTWVDQERYVPLKEELYAKSGKLLKRTELFNFRRIEGRWFPESMTFKDMLKKGKGTEFIIVAIQFDTSIPEHLFTKAALR